MRQSPTGRRPVISNVVVSYTVKPEAIEEHLRLIRGVFAQLDAEAPANIEYKVMQLADGVSFVHVSTADTPDGSNPLPELVGVQGVRRRISARGSRRPPAPSAATIVGSYHPGRPLTAGVRRVDVREATRALSLIAPARVSTRGRSAARRRSRESRPAPSSSCSPRTASPAGCAARTTWCPRSASFRSSTRRPGRSTSKAPSPVTPSRSTSSRSGRLETGQRRPRCRCSVR